MPRETFPDETMWQVEVQRHHGVYRQAYGGTQLMAEGTMRRLWEDAEVERAWLSWAYWDGAFLTRAPSHPLESDATHASSKPQRAHRACRPPVSQRTRN